MASYPNLIKNFYDFKAIGSGGFGRVYSAKYKKTGQVFAIKTLYSRDESKLKIVLTRFKNECQILKNIKHKNVVKITGVYINNDESYYAMEMINGQSLKDKIAQSGKIETETAVNYLSQICMGLIEIHNQNIVHRDIKPSNILIDKNTEDVKLIDFGISINEESLRMTEDNKTVGSVQYIAPEILQKEADASIQSDIYALGILLYEMLEGSVPFNAKDPKIIMSNHINLEIPRLKNVNVTIPQPLENIIIRCTAKKPEQRYENCKALLEDLTTCLSEKRAAEPLLNLNEKSSSKKIKKFLSSKVTSISIISVLAFAIVIIILVIVLWFKGVIH
ncbi:serine/threonine protein kinase [Mycoplasma struthionis]|uniref:Serine/threonine protein kinase n=1 Tax=Mycoplasma struthionis TaxID=538220 RepID=A0A502M2S0_9MOLU|nr:serine/threonine protein kinase [Mycoplasma struthionis]